MNYALRCKQCGAHFEVVESLAEHERHLEKCPECDSKNVRQEFGGVVVKTSKKS